MAPNENDVRQHEQSRQRQEEREQAGRRFEQGENPPSEEQPGVISVVDAVRDLEFPKTIDEIEERAGDRRVRVSKKGELPLRSVLAKLKEREFAGIRDFQSAVQRHWEGIRFLELPEEQRPATGGANPQDPRTRG